MLQGSGACATPLLRFERVGVFLGRPRSPEAGLRAICRARGKLLVSGNLTDIIVVKDDASSIRFKATWQEARFTLTLTANTGYIHVQDSSGSSLAFGSHVASVIGGSTHVAKVVGVPPTNAGMAPEPKPGRSTPVAEGAGEPELSAAGRGFGSAAGSVVARAAQGDTLVGEGNVIVNTTVVTMNEAADASSINNLIKMLRSVLRISRRGNDGEERRAWDG